MTDWNINTAKQTYSISNWSNGHVDVSADGHLLMMPDGRTDHAIDMFSLVSEISNKGLRFPVLVRFPDILKHRIHQLCDAFAAAATEQGYGGYHVGVYPIKVNQQHCVVQEILQQGGERVGLEAGSKPELMAVLALSRKGGVIVCNGYKDREYIRLALIGQKLGHQVYIVVENPSEVDLILQESKSLSVKPNIGIRLRLSSIGKGKWQNSGGEKAKFGLSASQVLAVIKRLKNESRLDDFKLLHYHMGSQIANIHDLQKGLQESARSFVELSKLGVKLDVLDVGGGLAVDYDGTGSRNECSMNYGMKEYANNVVRVIKNICDEYDIKHPNIFTESGRAMTAHHAVLVMNVIETEIIDTSQVEVSSDEDQIECVQALTKLLNGLHNSANVEQYHDAQYWYEQAQGLYNIGALSLEQRAQVEQLYFAVCRGLQGKLQHSSRVQRDVLDEINEKMADKYFCNFSVFQSIPDVWGIDQVFPIVPLHRLDEKPQRRGIIHDLTCDSDGHIEYYADNQGIEKTLPLHDVKLDEDYWLGVFLVGAYQEILGDMHNLFGDTDAINVRLKKDGGYELVDEEYGDRIEELLTYVHFNVESMITAYREKIAAANMSKADGADIIQELEEGIKGYTYFEKA